MRGAYAMKNSVIWRILILTVVYNVAANLVHPVTPTLILEKGMPDYLFGVLFASMAAGNFVCSALWGRLADRHGCALVMALSMAGYGVTQLAFGYSEYMSQMIIARFFSGCFTGGFGIAAMAMIVDHSTDRERASNLSLYAAFVSVMSAAGYFIGGLIGVLSIRACFWTQSIMLWAGGALALLLMGRHVPQIEGLTMRASTGGLRAARGLLTLPLLLFLLAVALANFGTYGYDNAFNYYIKEQLGFPSSYNGTIKAVTGLLGFGANLFLNRLIIKKFDGHHALTAMLTLCATTLIAAILMPNATSFIAMNIVFYLFNAMYVPIQQALVAEGRQSDIGLLSGLFSSAKCLGMVAGSLTAGFLYGFGAELPFYAMALAFALAAVVSFAQILNRRKHAPRPVTPTSDFPD